MVENWDLLKNMFLLKKIVKVCIYDMKEKTYLDENLLNKKLNYILVLVNKKREI